MARGDTACAAGWHRIEPAEKAAQIYVLTAHLPGINTIRDHQMGELAEFFGVKYRKDFRNLG